MENKIAKLQTKAVNQFRENKVNCSVAILFADMVGLSHFNSQSNTIDAWRNVLLHNQYCTDKIKEYQGIVIKYIGDGVMGRFNLDNENVTIDKVLECAVEIQKMIADYASFRTKIGVNVCKPGEAFQISRNDLIGTPVDIAARLTEIAKPSQILTSDRVVQMVLENDRESMYSIGAPRVRVIRGIDINIKIHEIGWSYNEETMSFQGIEPMEKIIELEHIKDNLTNFKSEIINEIRTSNKIVNKLDLYDIRDILPPSAIEGSDTKMIIDKYLAEYLTNKENIEIRSYGIALRKIFQTDGVLKNTLLERADNKVKFSFKSIILDPSSDAAKTRSLVEGSIDCINNAELKNEECVVYSDIVNSIQSIQFLLSKFSNEDFQVKISSFLPQMWFLMTDEMLFFEQYHIGRDKKNPISYKCLGGLVPVLQVGNTSPWYKYFHNQFEFLWNIQPKDPINKFFGMKELTTDFIEQIFYMPNTIIET